VTRDDTFDSRLQATNVPWREPGWLDDVRVWIAAHLSTRGSLRRRRAQPDATVVRSKPWSIVLRVDAPGGLFWFKEVGPAVEHEPVLTSRLARRLPARFPSVVAADVRRMLTVDVGPKLAKPTDLQSFARKWGEIVAEYARLQLELSTIPDLPAPNGRPAMLAARFGAEAEALVSALGTVIPESLVHLDVTRKNVCLRDGRPVFVDWGETVVGHPFFGLYKALRSLVPLGAKPGGAELLRVRDAYLEPWTGLAPARELRAIAAAAYALATLCHVIAVERKVASTAPAAREVHARKLVKRSAEKVSLLLASFAASGDGQLGV
jgi:hypothetical protein